MSLQWRMWTESSEERGQLERKKKKRPKTDIERRAADIYHLLLPPLLHIWKFLQTPSSPVFPSLSLFVCSFPSWNYERGLWHTVSQISYPIPEAMNNSRVPSRLALRIISAGLHDSESAE